MKSIIISVNPFAEFSSASESAKKRIIKQQLLPSKFRIPWYQKAKSTIRNYIPNVSDETTLVDGIEELKNKVPATARQITDKKVSIEALLRMQSFHFPNAFKEIKFEVIKSVNKTIDLHDVSIVVAPDVILKGVYKGKIVYGAVKIHICKSIPFDYKQTSYISSLLYQYLLKEIVKNDEIVLPNLCICLDVFANRFTPASDTSIQEMNDIKKICNELKTMWTA